MIASVVSVFLGLGLLGAVLRRRPEAKAEWLIAMTVLMFTVAYATRSVVLRPGRFEGLLAVSPLRFCPAPLLGLS